MRTVDENAFFREATLRICSSLDIETALRRCLTYLKDVIPATGLNLCLFKPETGVMENIAHIADAGDIRLQRVIAMPPDAWGSFLCSADEKVRIINRPEQDPATRMLTQMVGRPDSSILSMRLELEGEWLGIVSLLCRGKNRYKPEHGRLLTLLHEPFAVAMSNALRYRQVLRLKNDLADDNQYLHLELRRISGTDIIGADTGLKGVMDQVAQVAALNSPVLLLGETGVGKEVVANAVHCASSRRDGPLIKVNCGAIPESLIDSELFGHEKGAFTGATARMRGRFERAHGGTIFLDEIGELPPQAQVRLLRVIQHREIERVGGTGAIPVDIRIIAATHRDLAAMVAENRFREDLWFRLNVFPIRVPPLSERKADIPALTAHFLERKARELKFRSAPAITPDALLRLTEHRWPGNVRELENAIEHALIHLRGQGPPHTLTARSFAFIATPAAPAQPRPSGGDPIVSLDAAAAAHIRRALQQTGGKIHGPGGAAELLGVKPTTLRYRMDKLGIAYKRADGVPQNPAAPK